MVHTTKHLTLLFDVLLRRLPADGLCGFNQCKARHWIIVTPVSIIQNNRYSSVQMIPIVKDQLKRNATQSTISFLSIAFILKFPRDRPHNLKNQSKFHWSDNSIWTGHRVHIPSCSRWPIAVLGLWSRKYVKMTQNTFALSPQMNAVKIHDH